MKGYRVPFVDVHAVTCKKDDEPYAHHGEDERVPERAESDKQVKINRSITRRREGVLPVEGLSGEPSRKVGHLD